MAEENPGNFQQHPPIIRPTQGIILSEHEGSCLPPMRLMLEVAAVLAIAVFPDIYNAAASLIWSTSSGAPSFAFSQSWVGFRGICVVIAVLYIIHSSGDKWSLFGICKLNLVFDIPRAFVIFIACIVLFYLYSFLYGMSGLYSVTDNPQPDVSEIFAYPSQPAQYAVLIFVSLINGLAEELVMRAYLITRLSQLLRSKFVAVLITSLLFAAYHIYQGWFYTVDIFFTGLILGIAFVYLKRLWPLVLAHAMMDIFAMLPSLWS